MAKNVILGSGLIGLLAKMILPEDFIFVPFGFSRFYQYQIPLLDDFIMVSDTASKYFSKFNIKPSLTMYKSSFSHNGSLFKGDDISLMKLWLAKITNNDFPDHAASVMAFDSRFIYNVSCSNIYRSLFKFYQEQIKAGVEKGPVVNIDCSNRIITFAKGEKLEYDIAVSCIPLDILAKSCNIPIQLTYAQTSFLHLQSDVIDLEGSNQALVSDQLLDFYKVTWLGKNEYVFSFKNRVDDYGMYLLPIIGTADIIQATTVANVIPVGDPVDLARFEKHDIYPVGQTAQHDIALDVCSTILRLDKLKESWFQKRWKKL